MRNVFNPQMGNVVDPSYTRVTLPPEEAQNVLEKRYLFASRVSAAFPSRLLT